MATASRRRRGGKPSEEGIISDQDDTRSRRRQQILRAAEHLLGVYGVGATSLRDIASRAGVSLTLLSHHFGSKESLVRAVIDSGRPIREERLEPLIGLARGDRELNLASLVEAWIRYDFELFGRAEQRDLLRFTVRLSDDPDVDAAARHSLDAAAPHVRLALRMLRPRLELDDLELILRKSQAAIYAALLNLDKEGGDGALDRVREIAYRFVLGGLESALSEIESAHSGEF